MLFLPDQAEQIAALKSLIATWMRLAISQTTSLPIGDKRLWFVVDELDALGHIVHRAELFEAVRLGTGGGQDSGHGGGAGWRDSSFLPMPATTFMGSPGNVGKEDILERLGSVMAQLEALRTGRVPMTKASLESLIDPFYLSKIKE